MNQPMGCGSPEHTLARRQFLGNVAGCGGAAVAASGLGLFSQPAQAATLEQNQKRVLCIFLAGGVSQLESWDPKPATDTGGPFRAIPTSVKGLHICELLPHTAKQMHHLAVIRGINTKQDDHGLGNYLMHTGRRRSDPGEFPYLGSVVSKAISNPNSPLPGHISIGGGTPATAAAYLGPQYASVNLPEGGGMPPNIARPKELSADEDKLRQEFRRFANDRFGQRQPSAITDAYAQSYERALQMMEQRDVFDIAKETEQEQLRYGKHPFGKQCLLARRLIESGVPFVHVQHRNYDCHYENFNAHIERLGEFDQPFAILMDDLHQRGLLEHTLVMVISEFGRTPRINPYLGRDHWSKAWSIVLGGCGVQKEAVFGATNPTGTAVTDGEVDHANLFHTYLAAIGLDSQGSFDINGRPMPLADPASYAIKELLA